MKTLIRIPVILLLSMSFADNDPEGSFGGGVRVDFEIDGTGFNLRISKRSDSHVEGIFSAKFQNLDSNEFIEI